jgi:hypothetical protein
MMDMDASEENESLEQKAVVDGVCAESPSALEDEVALMAE